ncbi:unnamed protein product [Lathyrus oleraceus]
MKSHQTWPCISSSSRFTSLPLPNLTASELSAAYSSRSVRLCSRPPPSKPPPSTAEETDFSSLPYDVLTKIAASFDQPNLQAASLVCRSWCEALRPLREAMVMLMWGKRFKHGKRGVCRNTEKALDMFTKAAARGSALAMVDAGLIYWERVEPPNTEQALKWLYKASKGGNVRAQYQLALCLHRDGGSRSNIREAVKWYMKAAEGGYVRAMYNTSLCYSLGEGLTRNHRIARKWMKRAADRGHSKAQFEHGLALYSDGDMIKALVYLELASRAGEKGASHVKNVIVHRLSAVSQNHAMHLANSWRALPSN